MRQKVGGRMNELTRQENEISLVEFAEEVAPFPLSESQKQLLREYEKCEKNGNEIVVCSQMRSGKRFILQIIDEWKMMQNLLVEHRCSKCNRLLGKFNGQAEIKCPKCGKINRIGVYKNLAEQKGH